MVDDFRGAGREIIIHQFGHIVSYLEKFGRSGSLLPL